MLRIRRTSQKGGSMACDDRGMYLETYDGHESWPTTTSGSSRGARRRQRYSWPLICLPAVIHAYVDEKTWTSRCES